MAEWIVERGIGETRAALIDGDDILEARIAVDGVLAPGTVLEARLTTRSPERNQGVVSFAEGEALIRPLPRDVTEGGRLRVEIVREAIAEPGKPKRALARQAAPDAPLGPGAGLTALAAPLPPGGPDRLERAGWSALLEEAASGVVAFPGGQLVIVPTPAMAVIDVDGTIPVAALCVAGARAAARAIRRLDIGGSIGIDLPTTNREQRQAAADAIDAELPQPFERTTVNGFGFVQIVRRRTRRSLLELAREDPVGSAARALLRRAEHTPGAGPRTLAAAPAVIACLAAHPDWLEEVQRRMAAPLALREEARLAISTGHVAAQFP